MRDAEPLAGAVHHPRERARRRLRRHHVRGNGDVLQCARSRFDTVSRGRLVGSYLPGHVRRLLQFLHERLRIQPAMHVVPHERRGLFGLSFALPGRLQLVLRRTASVASCAAIPATSAAIPAAAAITAAIAAAVADAAAVDSTAAVAAVVR